MSAQQMHAPTADGVARAAAKIADLLPQTPLIEAAINGTRVWLKAESLQPIGSFKIRGAWHRLSDLSEMERAAGVVGVSSGNHAQGVAWAARKLGIAATIVMPANAPQVNALGLGSFSERLARAESTSLLRFRRQGFYEPIEIFVSVEKRLDENALVLAVNANIDDICAQP